MFITTERETKHIINALALEKMKSSAILINSSRGGLIDEEALLIALKDGQIAGAGLDLIDGEWMDDIAGHPLVKYAGQQDNLVITPHIGVTHTSQFMALVFLCGAQNCRLSEGKTTDNCDLQK